MPRPSTRGVCRCIRRCSTAAAPRGRDHPHAPQLRLAESRQATRSTRPAPHPWVAALPAVASARLRRPRRHAASVRLTAACWLAKPPWLNRHHLPRCRRRDRHGSNGSQDPRQVAPGRPPANLPACRSQVPSRRSRSATRTSTAPSASSPASCQHLADNPAMHIGETVVTPRMPKREPFVIQAHQMQNRGMQIVHMHRLFHRT